ncbi:prenyltransferase/squalene oxidase repeat-containing protein [Nocardioides pantholopis]|uniref:hypothetical protein n=1 Tax=Nocardioides pantholopis TaxID=2483798 RepID=UPI000F095BFE|nr:hypothetical protein [Nocardioides pantholopis]
MSTPRRRRSGALLAGGVLVASGLTLAGPSAPATAATSDPRSAALSARWLVGEIQADGLLHTTSEYAGERYEGPSYGGSIDAANALRAVGGHQATVARITDAIGASIAAYAAPTATDVYSGSAAKALALLVDEGRTPPTVRGGTDLLELVEGTVSTEPGLAGRLQDAYDPTSEWAADYANTIGQAFAARALTQTGSGLADEVTGYLLDQQCGAGFFRLYFAEKTAADQTCDGADPALPTDQAADTTALVALQLADLAGNDAEIAGALDRAEAWLLAQQRPDGSFADPQNGVNANTTGLAGWALDVLGADAAATRAATWLRARQLAGECEPGLAREAGAVAYDDAGISAARTYGLADPLDRTPWVGATVQALPALLAAPAPTAARSIAAPRGYVRAGSRQVLTVRGLAAGERACVTGAGRVAVLGSGAAAKVRVTVPGGTRNRTVRVSTADGSATTAVQALGRKRLQVALRVRAVRPGGRQVVTVRGLAPRESVRVALRGRVVAKGRATRAGTFRDATRVGARRGAVKVRVTGQFAHRSATTSFRVR